MSKESSYQNFTNEKDEDSVTTNLADPEKHRAQAIEYKKLALLFKKNNMVGLIEMFATLGPLYFVSDITTPYLKPLGCALALLAVFFMGKDYVRSKNLDEKIVRLVSSGVELEKKRPSFDRFFHNILGEFSVARILASRSICTVMCIHFLSSSINKIFVGKDPAVGGHKIILGLFGVVIGAIACIFYYSSYKKINELKSSA